MEVLYKEMLFLQKSLMQNVTNQTGRPPHMHNTKAILLLFFVFFIILEALS